MSTRNVHREGCTIRNTVRKLEAANNVNLVVEPCISRAELHSIRQLVELRLLQLHP